MLCLCFTGRSFQLPNWFILVLTPRNMVNMTDSPYINWQWQKQMGNFTPMFLCDPVQLSWHIRISCPPPVFLFIQLSLHPSHFSTSFNSWHTCSLERLIAHFRHSKYTESCICQPCIGIASCCKYFLLSCMYVSCFVPDIPLSYKYLAKHTQKQG